jgi:hypothetical protein
MSKHAANDHLAHSPGGHYAIISTGHEQQGLPCARSVAMAVQRLLDR